MIEIISGLAEGRRGENWLEGEYGKFLEGKNSIRIGVIVMGMFFS